MQSIPNVCREQLKRVQFSKASFLLGDTPANDLTRLTTDVHTILGGVFQVFLLATEFSYLHCFAKGVIPSLQILKVNLEVGKGTESEDIMSILKSQISILVGLLISKAFSRGYSPYFLPKVR